ncbi:MAG: ROK family protein [Myxococcales bacterium]
MARSNGRKHWAGFDLGGTKMLATIYDPSFKAVGSRRRKTKEFKGPRAGVQGIIKTIDEALEVANLERRALGGIGIGCPGVLELDKGVIQHAPNLGWRNVPLARELEKVFGCKVYLVNDVDAGTYGEYRFGAGKGARCVIGVFPGTGIGGGCVYDGKLIRGRVSSCFEFGHLHMAAKGGLCGCGRWGCLETVAGRLAISAEAAKAAFRGQAPHLLELAGTDLTAIRSRVLAEAIEAGDEAIDQNRPARGQVPRCRRGERRESAGAGRHRAWRRHGRGDAPAVPRGGPPGGEGAGDAALPRREGGGGEAVGRCGRDGGGGVRGGPARLARLPSCAEGSSASSCSSRCGAPSWSSPSALACCGCWSWPSLRSCGWTASGCCAAAVACSLRP